MLRSRGIRVTTGALAAALCAAVALTMALTAVPALAVQSHAFTTSFGAAGSGDGELSLVHSQVIESPLVGGSGVAVNETTHDVYVADTGNNRVDEFSSSGAFIRAFGADVGGTGVNICTLGCLAGTPGSAPGQLEAPNFIAVDNSAGESGGDVYVATGVVPDLISKFDKEGNLIETWGNHGPGEDSDGQLAGKPAEPKGCSPPGPSCSAAEHFKSFTGVTVDAAGDLWVYDQNTDMFEFGQEGGFIKTWSGASRIPFGIAIDSAQDLYVSDVRFSGIKEAVAKFSSSGQKLGLIFFPFAVTGLVVDPAHNDLYVDEAGASIEDISPQCELTPPSNNTTTQTCAPIQTFGTGHLSAGAGLAVDSATGTVYAASTATDQITVFPAVIEATIAAANPVGGKTATLHGKVNPEGSGLARCKFEYGTSKDYGKSVPCEESLSAIGSGTVPVPVEAKISELNGGTTYHFRLHATNANGDVRSEDGEFITLPLPVISEISAARITSTTAELSAKLNPEGLATVYHFEYGTADCAHSSCTSVPVSPEAIGSGTFDVAVSRHIEGLIACTTYHFRVLATDINGTTVGSDNTFVYLPSCEGTQICPNARLRSENNSTNLPDCRSYEMVTPAYTGGFLVQSGASRIEGVTGSGAGVFVAHTFGAFGGAENNPKAYAEYEFTRSSSGWQTIPLDPSAAQLPENISSIEAFSPDLRSYVNQLGSAPANTTFTPEMSFYLREPSGHFTVIGPSSPKGTLAAEGYEMVLSRLQGVSADLSHILFTSQDQRPGERFWSGDQTFVGKRSLYEYAGIANAAPRMVAVTGGASSHALIGQCGSSLGGGKENESRYNAVSSTGETVFFSVAPRGCHGYNPFTETEQTGQGPPVDEIYARLHSSETVAVSEPTTVGPAADCSECQEGAQDVAATYLAASADGSRVLFSTTQKLLPSDTDSTVDLYEYDFKAPAGHKIIQVSAGGTGDPSPGAGAEVQGLVTVSPDLSRVYFVAQGVLSGENAEHRSPAEGQDNLYVYEPDPADPGGEKTVFIATLAAGDSADWAGFGPGEGYESLAKVTPDGRYLLFPSSADLTLDDTSTASQLFQYDSSTGRLVRVSIGQDGYNNNGNGSVAIGAGRGYQSTDGLSVFFNSTVPLTPQAAESSGFNSVYEWEADGAGACTQALGCVYLISDGHDTHDIFEKGSLLAGISPTGSDVYFETADSLIPSDTNTQQGVYDARLNGGFPLSTPPPFCSGETCQPQGTALTEPSPSTFAFSGSGNLVAPIATPAPSKAVKCAKPKKLSHGKCVKVKTKNKKKHKAENKRKSKKARKTNNNSKSNREVKR